MVTFSDLTAEQYIQLFSYLFLPILLFGLGVYVAIILSNRMGRNNLLIKYAVRVLLVGSIIAALCYYFYYFATVILVA